MTKTIDITEAKNHLEELISSLAQCDEIIVTTDAKPYARMASFFALKRERIPGLGKGDIVWISDDFDDPLPDEFWLGDDDLMDESEVKEGDET